MTETSKFLAPETVNMLVQRANSGGTPGFQVGDTVKYIIKYKPVPNGGNTGANGYITDYIPNGMQVVGAAFVQPDGFGGYFEVPPLPAGDMSNDPGGNGTRNYVSLTPLLPATPLNTLGVGTMAQWYADVGIWYSTDIRTAFNPLAPPASSRNLWDTSQLSYDAPCGFKGAAGPWGVGSPVAGPDTFYQFEVLGCAAGPVGPWHRIAYPGSRIGTYGLMGDLQASLATAGGRDVSVSPLPVSSPTTPVTIRWANGLNSVGEVKYVSVTVQIASLPPGGTIINNSEVWGGDVFYGEGGKDNAWKYNNTLVSIGNNSDLTVIKTPSVESAQPGDVVSFQVTVINTGAGTQTNVKVTDYLQASTEAKPGKPFEIMVAYNCDATGVPIYGGAGGIAGATMVPSACPGALLNPGNQAEAILVGNVEALQWSIPSLSPGSSYTYTYTVTALVPPNPKVTSASDQVVVTSDQLLAPGAASAASFEIGTFPLLAQTKTVTPTSVLPGGTVRYHVQIINSGSGYAGVYRWGVPVAPSTIPPNVAYPVNVLAVPMTTTIQDSLPAGFSYAGNPTLTINSAPVLGSLVSAVGSQVTWTIPHTILTPNEIPPNAVLDLYFDVSVASGVAAGIYKNTVFTSVPYNKKPKNQLPAAKDWALKPLYSINVAPVTVGAVQMTKVATPSSVTNTPTGTSTSYTITVTNNGAVAATSVVVTDTLPAGFTYQAASTSGTAGVGEPVVSGQNVVWPAFNVPANSSRSIVFNADIGASVLPAAYFNDVTATASNASIPDLLHVAPVIVAAPGLTVNKTVDRPVISWLGEGAIVPVTDTVNYTITLTNSGTGYATVDVSDHLPAGFFFPALGTELVTMTVGGVPQVMARGALNTATTYNTWPGSVVPLAPVGTRTPNWGSFIIPPKQGALDTTLTIQFLARVDMAANIVAPAIAVTQPGIYNNSVTVAGNAVVPIFTGAPVEIVRPVSKSTTTPNVAVNGVIDYRIQVSNHDLYSWTGVSVVDYLGSLTTLGVPPAVPSGVTYGVGNAAYYAIGTTAPAGAPGVDPLWLLTAPVNVAPNLTFNNAGIGFTIPAGQNLFIAYTATAPAAVPLPATVHNSVQSLSYTSNAVPYVITNVYDGALPANTADDVTITLTPTVSLSATKTVTPSALYLYGAAAPNALTYSITLNNSDLLISATGITLTDTLPPGFNFGVGDTATVSINAGAPVALVPVYTPPVLPAVSGTLSIPLGANVIPPAGNAVVTFTVSVAALTPANTYFNSATWLGTNVNAGSVGPTAPVVVDPVSVSKQALTPSVIAGGTAKYRLSVLNTGNLALNGLNIVDTFGGLVPATPSGFTYLNDAVVSLNGVPLVAGVDYTAPVLGSVAPAWSFITPITAGTVTSASTLNIDFYATVPAAALAGTVNNSISSLSFTPGALPLVTSLAPYDGAVPANTADDVAIATLGISKAVVSPYATVVNDPVLGTLTKYVISVTNSSAAAQLVDITDTLPTGFSYQLGSTLINGLPAADPVVALQTLTWAAQNIAVGTTTIQFTAAIAGTVPPAVYNNQANVLIGGISTASFNGAPVTVTSPQIFLSKITTTPNVGKDIYGNYSPAHYKLSITNVGSSAATGVTILDTLPLGFTYDPLSVQVSINGVVQTAGTYAVPAPLLGTFNFTTVPVGGFTVPAAAGGVNGNLTIEYDAFISPATVPLLAGHTNTATASSTNATAPAPATATVTLFDVGLSKVTSTPSLSAGGTAIYTITVSNFGAAAIPNVNVSDFLPFGFTYIPLTTTGTGWVATEPNLVNGPGLPIWNIPSLPANTSATITFHALVASTATAGIYRNSVVAVGNFGGVVTVPFPITGQTAPITITEPQPLLTVLKQASAAVVSPGDTVVYTVQVSNTGTGVANAVIITDALSPDTKLALAPFALPNTTMFSFVDGANPSGLPGTGTVTFSDNNGANYTYTPIDDGTGHDPAITNFKIIMDGTMNANQAANPSFSLQYQVQVK